jgi:hypothetical protein
MLLEVKGVLSRGGALWVRVSVQNEPLGDMPESLLD